MSRRQSAVVVLVSALGLLGGSIAWAVDAARGNAWYGHRYSYGPAMMGLGYSTGKASPVSGIAAARQRAQAFADRLGLKTGEVMRFERNYYVKLVDRQGRGATEVLVDPSTGAVSLEYGPAMMWNTRYGMMSGRLGSGMMGNGVGDSGMMGGFEAAPSQPAARPTSLARAHLLAQRWLDANEPGLKVERGGDAFPGYYTLETLRGGRMSGMISVNAGTGAVWPHWWHGRFVEHAA